MENYKKMLKDRIKATGSLLALVMIFGTLITTGAISTPEVSGNFGDFFDGFKYGLYIMLLLIGIYSVASCSAAIKDEKKLKKMYIEETDERNMKISELVGIKLYNALVYPLFVATVISGYFSAEVFFTLLGVIAFISVMTFARKMYYSKNM